MPLVHLLPSALPYFVCQPISIPTCVLYLPTLSRRRPPIHCQPLLPLLRTLLSPTPPPLARARQIRCTPPPTLFHRCFVRHHRAIDHRCLFIYIIERLIGRNPLLPPRRHPPLPLPPPPHANTRARCRGMAYLCCIPWRQAMQRIGTLLARRHHIMYYCQLRKSLSTCSFSWLDLFDFLLCQIIELITCRNLIVLMVWYLPILVHRAIG